MLGWNLIEQCGGQAPGFGTKKQVITGLIGGARVWSGGSGGEGK